MKFTTPRHAAFIAALAIALPAAAEEPPSAPPEAAAPAPEAEAAPSTPSPEAATADTVVARVGETEITLGHVLTIRRQLPQEYAQLPDEMLLQGIVDQLVDQQLLAAQMEGTKDLPPSLALRLENDRRAILATAAVQEIAAGEVDDAAVQAAYDAAYGDVEPATEYNASHILVDTEEEAKAIVTELEGGADFAALAEERSTDPSAAGRGGSLGWFGIGQMVPEFEQAVMGMEPGAVSAPVETQFGWHVVKLNETREVPPPALDEVRAELETQVRQERVAARLDELRAAAAPEIMIDQIDPSALRDDSLLAE